MGNIAARSARIELTRKGGTPTEVLRKWRDSSQGRRNNQQDRLQRNRSRLERKTRLDTRIQLDRYEGPGTGRSAGGERCSPATRNESATSRAMRERYALRCPSKLRDRQLRELHMWCNRTNPQRCYKDNTTRPPVNGSLTRLSECETFRMSISLLQDRLCTIFGKLRSATPCRLFSTRSESADGSFFCDVRFQHEAPGPCARCAGHLVVSPKLFETGFPGLFDTEEQGRHAVGWRGSCVAPVRRSTRPRCRCQHEEKGHPCPFADEEANLRAARRSSAGAAIHGEFSASVCAQNDSRPGRSW